MIEVNRKIHLTERQMEVLYYIAKGYSNSEIADKMYITEHTVKAHIGAIYETLKTNTRVQAAIKAIQHGLLKLNTL